MTRSRDSDSHAGSKTRTWSCLDGGGDAGARLRTIDWRDHPLGPPDAWSAAVKTAVSLTLAAQTPMIALIGRDCADLCAIFNDACGRALGAEDRQGALGGSFRTSWPELYRVLQPAFDAVLRDGAAARLETNAVMLKRGGANAAVWFSHAYSPLRDETGTVVGVLGLITETTDAVRTAARLDVRARLAERLQGPTTQEGVLAEAAAAASDVYGPVNLQVRPRPASPSDPQGAQLIAPLDGAAASPDPGAPSVGGLDLVITPQKPDAARLADPAAAIEIAHAVSVALEREARLRAGREEAERLDLALEAARLGHFRWDARSSRLELSPRAADIFGFPHMARPLWDDLVSHIHSDDLPGVHAVVAAGMASGVYETHYRFRRPVDGAWIWIGVRGRTLKDDQGGVVGRLGMVWDDTPLKTVEQQLRQERAELEDLQRRQGFLLEVNEAAREDADEDAATAMICQKVGAFLGLDRVSYAVLGETPTQIEVDYDWRAGGEAATGPLDVGALVAAAGSRLGSGTPVVISDVDDEAPWRALAASQDHAVRAAVFLPIRREQRLCAIFIAGAKTPRRWTTNEVDLLGLVAERLWTRRERARAERRILESEAQLQALMATVPALVFITDPEGANTYVNERMCAYTGLPQETLMGDGWSRVIHPDDSDRAVSLWRRSVAAGAPFEAEYRMRRADGVARWHLVRGQPVHDDAGVVRRWVGACIDVQESVKARELLARHRDDLAQEVADRTAERDRIWRLSPDLMGVLTLTGSLISVNPAWSTTLGVSLDTLVGRPLSALRHPDDEPESRSLLACLKDGESRVGHEDRLGSPASGWRWISWAFNREGPMIYCIGRDVTADKAAEAALLKAQTAHAEASAQHRAHFESSSDLLFILDAGQAGFRYIAANPHMAAYGLGETDIIGKTPKEALGPDAGARLEQQLRQCAQTRERVSYAENVTLAGVERDFETSLVPILAPDGRVVRILGASRDVTERIRMDEQLRQSQKLQAVGQLAGGIAHDFNNLLSAVVGSLDLLRRRTDLDPRALRYVENALGAAERGARLTAQLLTFSRAQKIHREPVAVAPLITGMRDLLERTLGPHIRLRLSFETNAPPILADPTQLEMAVLNLAINARDAMADGGRLEITGAKVEVEADLELAPGAYLALTVSDTGEGMAPEVLTRAFDPFFTTKGVGKGTGLGLSQVYAFARQADGDVRIRSLPGEGAQITLYLPLMAQEEAPPPPPQALDAPPWSASAEVLVIDDDPSVRSFLIDALESLGYRARAADDGETGLAAAAARRPDVVLLDYGMPGLSGAETARRLRALGPDIPVIFVSGYADTAAIEAALGRETPRLAKPFRVEDLQAILRRTLARAQGASLV